MALACGTCRGEIKGQKRAPKQRAMWFRAAAERDAVV
jgi:hypothetical protein